MKGIFAYGLPGNERETKGEGHGYEGNLCIWFAGKRTGNERETKREGHLIMVQTSNKIHFVLITYLPHGATAEVSINNEPI